MGAGFGSPFSLFSDPPWIFCCLLPKMLAHIYKGGEGDKVKDETVVDLI